MRLSSMIYRNLNKRHWDRRAWEIGYRGPLLPQQKATGRPDYPISPDQVELLRQRFQREFEVMKMLTRPYIDKEAEKAYFASEGVSSIDELRAKEQKRLDDMRMPGKEKKTDSSAVKIKGNIGNMLHRHRTVEDSMSDLLRNSNRWD